MTLLAARLDTRIERSAGRRVVHPSRIKHVLPNGRVSFVFQSGTLKHFFDVAHGMRSQRDYEAVMSAFYVVMGEAYDGLLFRDWSDYIATSTNTTIISLGGGDYRLARAYTFGGQTYARPISRPVASSVVVLNSSGTPLTHTLGDLGEFTVSSGTPAAWTGQFDVPVAFAKTEWASVVEGNYGAIDMRHEQIELEEIIE